MKKKNGFWKYIFRVILVFIILVAAYIAFFMAQKVNGVKSIFQNIEEKEANLTEYIVYGTHLNLKGNINVQDTNIAKVKLCFRTIDELKNKKIDLRFENTSNGVSFYTSELINEGIDLETLEEETYYLFIEIIYQDSVSKCYSIKNKTKYQNVEYYTITKNEKNNKIDIAFNTRDIDNKKLEYMYLNVRYVNLPDTVYDIVIDPGHGRKRRWS